MSRTSAGISFELPRTSAGAYSGIDLAADDARVQTLAVDQTLTAGGALTAGSLYTAGTAAARTRITVSEPSTAAGCAFRLATAAGSRAWDLYQAAGGSLSFLSSSGGTAATLSAAGALDLRGDRILFSSIDAITLRPSGAIGLELPVETGGKIDRAVFNVSYTYEGALPAGATTQIARGSFSSAYPLAYTCPYATEIDSYSIEIDGTAEWSAGTLQIQVIVGGSVAIDTGALSSAGYSSYTSYVAAADCRYLTATLGSPVAVAANTPIEIVATTSGDWPASVEGPNIDLLLRRT